MEQQKILWIAFSIGFLILTIVVGALIFVSPDPALEVNNINLEQETEGNVEFDPYEWVRSDEEHPGLEDTDAMLDGDGSFEVMLGEDSEANEKLAIEVKKETAIEKNTSSDLDKIKKNVVVKVEPPKQKKIVKEVPVKKHLNEYWIQAGSFKSESRAEQVRNDLSQKGFAARVVSKTINNINYFRVRIGPYTVKGEADKFLAWVKGIKGFEDCYISKVLVYR